MNLLKFGKKIFKVDFTEAEKKAIHNELRKIAIDWQNRHEREIDAMILWRLHNTFGWGPERLWRFYSGFHKDTKELIKRYELEPTDDVWIATKALNEYGIDLEEWEKKKMEIDNADK